MYLGIDLGVEVLVFALTIVTLKRVLPNISPWRVLSGVLKMHTYPMTICVPGLVRSPSISKHTRKAKIRFSDDERKTLKKDQEHSNGIIIR